MTGLRVDGELIPIRYPNCKFLFCSGPSAATVATGHGPNTTFPAAAGARANRNFVHSRLTVERLPGWRHQTTILWQFEVTITGESATPKAESQSTFTHVL